MIQNKNLYRNQSSSQADISNNQQVLPPNVNKKQLKELILAKYKKDFKNPKNIEKIKQIIDEHFTKLNKIDQESFKQIKEDITNKVGLPNQYGISPSYSMSNLSKTPKVQRYKSSNAPALPDISQSQLVSKNIPEDQDKRNLEKLLKDQEKEQQIIEKQERKQSRTVEKQQIAPIKIPTEETNKQLAEQLRELQNSTRQIQTDINQGDSPRSVYQVQQGDEWTSMIHKDAEKFRREQEEKKEKAKINQKKMKIELDQQVKFKKVLRHKQRVENKNLENSIALNEIERFDKIQEMKKLKQKEQIQLMGKMLQQQKEIKNKEKEENLQQEEQINAEIVKKAEKEYKTMQENKSKKRLDEYQFFKKVKEEHENYKQTIKTDPKLSKPQYNLFQKNYDNIARDYSNVYRKASMDYPGMDSYFERNKEIREKIQREKNERIQKYTEPLKNNFEIPDPVKNREDEKLYYQSKFQQDEQRLEQEKIDAFNKKRRIIEEINHDLDNQVLDNQQKRKEQRNLKLEQAYLWEEDNKNYSTKQSEKLKKQKQLNLELQEFLKQQMSEKSNNKKGFKRMNNEELLYNKSNLKDMYSSVDQNTNIFQKAQTSNFKHIKHVA